MLDVRLIETVNRVCFFQKPGDPAVKQKITNLARLALDRAEALKGTKTATPSPTHYSADTLPNLPSVPETSLSPTISVKATPLPQGNETRKIDFGHFSNWLFIASLFNRQTTAAFSS